MLHPTRAGTAACPETLETAGGGANGGPERHLFHCARLGDAAVRRRSISEPLGRTALPPMSTSCGRRRSRRRHARDRPVDQPPTPGGYPWPSALGKRGAALPSRPQRRGSRLSFGSACRGTSTPARCLRGVARRARAPRKTGLFRQERMPSMRGHRLYRDPPRRPRAPRSECLPRCPATWCLGGRSPCTRAGPASSMRWFG